MNTIAFFMSFLPLILWFTYGLFFIFIPSWIYSLGDETDYFHGLLLIIGMCAVAYFFIQFMDLYYSKRALFK